MDPSSIANLVVDLSIRYSFQVLAALAILAAGFVCARIVGRFVERSLRTTSLEKHLRQLHRRAPGAADRWDTGKTRRGCWELSARF